MRQYIAGENEEGMRLSRFVLRVTRGLPESVMYKSFRNKRIKRNGSRAAAADRLHCGDVVQLYLNDEFFAAPADENSCKTTTFGTKKLLPQSECKTPDVVWQDSRLAVLYKPAGLLSHSDATKEPTLQEQFINLLLQTGEYRPQNENTFVPALCNRLDRGTEGLVFAAKSGAALRAMNQLIREDQVEKTYLCIAVGLPPEGLHQGHWTRDIQRKTSVITKEATPQSKPVCTGIKVLESVDGLSLCQVALHTGRTHQIRAHLALLGAPLLGDTKYGNATANRQYGIKRQALCAWKLALRPLLPKENTLCYLQGRSFTAGSLAALPDLWKK